MILEMYVHINKQLVDSAETKQEIILFVTYPKTFIYVLLLCFIKPALYQIMFIRIINYIPLSDNFEIKL